MSEIKLKACMNCKHYEKNYRCRIFSITNTQYQCQFWEGRIDEEEKKEQSLAEMCEEVKEDDPVNHPKHYIDGRIEVIEYIEDKNLGFCLGNAIKYISRAGKKEKDKEIQDLRKAMWYIERRIYELENNG